MEKNLKNTAKAPDPQAFGMASFAQILPAREPILGEDFDSFDGFRAGIVRTLSPATPYECVVAENLVAIEWELLQHRRMRDAGVRRIIREAICDAVVEKGRQEYEAMLDEAFEKHEAEGGTDDDWEEPFEFDRDAAREAGEQLAARAILREPEEQSAAYKEIAELGLEPVELMGGAYRTHGDLVVGHEEKIVELERRRREVKRDLDLLQGARPTVPEIIDE